MYRRALTMVILALLGAVFSGCSEREQTASYIDGKYRGKPDARPWDSAPPGDGSANWTKGDQDAWENQMKARNATQNEYGRIGH